MKPAEKYCRLFFLIFSLLFSACSLPISKNSITPVPTEGEVIVIPPMATQASPVIQETQPPVEPTSPPMVVPSPTNPILVKNPTQTSQPTPALTQISPLPTGSKSYATILVAEGGVLNIRSAPGSAATVISTLDPGINNILLTGKDAQAENKRWVELDLGSQSTGWVDDTYLTEYVSPGAFCLDKRIDDVVAKFIKAITSQDGQLLVSTISPKHGLYVTDVRGGTAINYDAAHAPWVFTSTFEVDWGLHPGSGLPVKGSFSGIVLPNLLDVFTSSYTRTCENVSVGGTTYTASWPKEFQMVNMLSFYRPGPAGKELDWRTWLVGFEYVGGQPYVVALYQLTWEP